MRSALLCACSRLDQVSTSANLQALFYRGTCWILDPLLDDKGGISRRSPLRRAGGCGCACWWFSAAWLDERYHRLQVSDEANHCVALSLRLVCVHWFGRVGTRHAELNCGRCASVCSSFEVPGFAPLQLDYLCPLSARQFWHLTPAELGALANCSTKEKT